MKKTGQQERGGGDREEPVMGNSKRLQAGWGTLEALDARVREGVLQSELQEWKGEPGHEPGRGGRREGALSCEPRGAMTHLGH